MSHKNDVVTALLLLFLVPFAAAQAGGDLVPPPPSDFNFGPVFNPTMAIVMIVLVSAFFSLGFFSVYVRHCSARRSHGGAADTELLFGSDRRISWRSGRRGIGEDVIRTFPTFLYSAVKRLKIGKGALECAVCLNEFEDNETLRLMPKCSHVFHADCVDAWLSSHDTCPVCRANLVPKPGEDLAVQISDPEPTDQNRPARTRSTGMRFGGLFPFPRSHSTGHSLVQPGENRERFTLRLPEDIMMNLNRARSVGVLPRARSERKGFRSGSSSSSFPYERFDQETRPDWWSLSMVPPFVSRTGSVRSTRSTGQRSLLPSFIGSDNVGERSSDRLQPNVEV